MSDNATPEIQEHSTEYRLLLERPDNWSQEWSLSEYVHLTDGLIGKLDGSIPLLGVEVYHQGEKEVKDLPPPSDVIYLDKSARPVSWLVSALWPTLAGRQNGELPKRPGTHFLNIDKADWLRRMDVPPKYLEDTPAELIDYDKIDVEQLARIRALFSTVPIDEAHLDTAWDYPTIFNDKHVMIVDEVKSSGQTLEIAKNLISRALPEAIISGQYWATPPREFLNRGVPDKDGVMQFKISWVPAWYNPSLESGRGIGNKNPNWPEIAESLGKPTSRISKVGRYVLGTSLKHPETYESLLDPRSKDLRDEIDMLASDIQKKKVLYRPSRDRLNPNDRTSYQDFIDRVQLINGMTYEDWRARRDAIEPKKT